jgi:hypothetical protein
MVVVIKKGSTKEFIKKALLKIKRKRVLNAYKHFGVIKLTEDPLVIQKKMRDEW